MRKSIATLFLVLALTVSGCAGTQVGSDGLERQAAGVIAALDALPPVPADAETQAQVAGWKTWLSYLAKAGSTIAVAALKARGM